MEGWGYGEIDREYPNGVVDVDPREVCCPMDDDLAQAVELSEALLKGGDYVGEFGERLVDWARENGRGIGITTSRVISVLEAGHRPPKAARIVYEESPIAPNGGVYALRAGGSGAFSSAGTAGQRQCGGRAL